MGYANSALELARVEGVGPDQLFTIVGSAEIVEEKRLREIELERLRAIKVGINKLSELSDFTVDGDSVYLTGIQRSLPQLMVEKFTEIVNNLDLVKDSINSTKYKLLFLK